MNIIKYIKKNPKLAKAKISVFLFFFFGIVTVLLTHFSELLPANLTSILTLISGVYATAVTVGIIEGRGNLLYEKTGSTVNEHLENDKFIME